MLEYIRFFALEQEGAGMAWDVKGVEEGVPALAPIGIEPNMMEPIRMELKAS